MTIPRDAIVLVTGASGFLGQPTVTTLAEHGFRVRALTRRPARWPLPARADVEVMAGDLRDAASLAPAVADAAAVVHLAAALADEPESEDVNVAGTARLVAAARAAGCARWIQVSTQSAKIARKGVYGRTKAEADARVEASGLAVTILLPSLVYGAQARGVFGTVARLVRRLPVLPILGDGRWRSAPIHVGDVAEAIARCLERDATIGRRYDLGGPELLSFDELVDRIGAAQGVRVRKLHVPFPIALAAAQALTAVWPGAPITVSNVLGSNQDTAIDCAPAQRDFGFAPRALDVGLAELANAPAGPGAAPRAAAFVTLADEARLLARYLLGVEPPAPLVERYVAAHRALLGEPAPGDEDPALAFVRRHPRALPFLDAGLGWRDPGCLLRRKLVLAAAVLETSPAYADWFLAPPPGAARALASLAAQGAASAAKLAVGVPLCLWLEARG